MTPAQEQTVGVLRELLRDADPRARVDGPDGVTSERESVFEVRLGGFGHCHVGVSPVGALRILRPND